MSELAWLSDFHFLRPWWLLLLLPFAAISALLWQRGDLSRQWRGVIAPHLLPHMIVRGSQRRVFSPLWVSVILNPLLVVAIAGPAWERADSPFAQDSAALIIAIDLSASMSESDLQPSRLQRARSKVLQLADARGDAPTALLAYAGTAHTVLPLSDDKSLLLHYLDALEVGMLPRRGKAPESSVPLARELLAERAAGGTLLLIGDGANEDAASAFAPLAESSGIQLLVWGMGKTREELEADRARGLDGRAQPLQESQLVALADAGDGRYQRVTVDDTDVRTTLRRINRHFRVGDDSARPWVDGGYYLLAPIMLLFILWFRRGWVLQW